MDDAEVRAKQCLESMGFSDIEPEPEGKSKFPDFRVNKQIGVEVRRLNITHDGESKAVLGQFVKTCRNY